LNGDVIVRLADFISEKVLGRCTGEFASRTLDEAPSQTFFIGTLNPRAPITRKGVNKISPCRMSISGLADGLNPDDEIEITVSGYFYYRVFPTFQEQNAIRNVHLAHVQDDEEGDADDSEADCDASSYRIAYKKTQALSYSEIIPIRNLQAGEPLYPLIGLELAVKKMSESAYADKEFWSESAQRAKPNMKGQGDYDTAMNAISKSKSPPSWKLSGALKATRHQGKVKLTLLLENAADECRESENTFFESQIIMKLVKGKFSPYVLDYLAEDYKFNGNVGADGLNCSGILAEPNIIKSCHAPVFRQKRHKSKTFTDLSFERFVNEPESALSEIKRHMNAYMNALQSEYDARSGRLSESNRFQYKHDLDEFSLSIERFNEGLKVLSSSTRAGLAAMEAFLLLNRSFSSSTKKFTAWRPFQIIFIVSLIPDIVCVHQPEIKNSRNMVDLIYFPTGGGKTEAYLGIVVFQMFFDRLMGKKAGVSAMTRFPLRLLSLQQLQRIADIVAEAEKVRRTHAEISKADYEPFSTGYFVGGGNTPNKVGREVIEDIATGRVAADKWLIIRNCPFCHGADSVRIKGDPDRLRILHICTNPNCLEDELPVYISDPEIFRYLPTFIISTVDKTATVGWQKNFRHIFGQVAYRCPKHGYLSGNKCVQKEECRVPREEWMPVQLVDPTPSLLIQDELHLIRESLGSYSSHYESFLDAYMHQLTGGGKRMKIIGATATIQQFEHHIRQLYGRRAIQFPPSSPSLTDSFYAYLDNSEESRLIVGLMPHNKTMIFAVLNILQYYFEEVQNLEKDITPLTLPPVGFSTKSEASQALTHYKLLLNYNLIKRDGDAITYSVRTMINPSLKSKDVKEMKVRSMTGDVTFAEVKEVLKAVEGKEPQANVDLITATSMISHGVDIDEMNFMVFRGMPRSIAEYIQAYSRVGRKYPGIVFVVYNHSRERDQSYYKFFNKFHEYQSILVEPVPINRWAQFTINRTLPGIFSGLLMNYYGTIIPTDMYMAGHFCRAFSNNDITTDGVAEFLLRSYLTSESEKSASFTEYIRKKTEQYIYEILDKKDSPPDFAFIPKALSDTPMASLRDTDRQIEIGPAPESFDAMRRVGSLETRGSD